MTFPGLHHGPRLSVLSASLGYLDFREMSYSLSFKSHFVVVGCLMDLCLKRDRFPGNILVGRVGCVDFLKDFRFVFTVLGGFVNFLKEM